MVYVAFDIYPAATPNGSLLVRLTASEAVELTCKKVLHGTGEGTIRIHSSHPDATTTNFAKRNYVKVVVVNGATETEWFGFFLEQGDFGAISRREQGGRMLTFTGLGSLFYLDRAVLLADIYAPGQPRRGNLTIDGQWGWNDVPYGAIMTRVMEEGIYAPGSPLAEATYDFSRDDDSDGNPWPNIDNEFTVPWGTSAYEIIAAFIRLGLIVTVDPDLEFHAWQTYGTNRTSGTFAAGKVRYEHGVNIGNEVVRQIRASLERSHMFVTGDEFTSTVVDGGSSSVTYYDTLPRQETNDIPTLEAAGERDLNQREIQADAAFPVRVVIDDDELNGLYVPGEHYDVGDIVTIDTVPPSGASGDHDYVNFAIEVAAIKLEHDDAANWFAVNELGAQYLTAQLQAFEASSARLVSQIELCRTDTAVAPAIESGAWISTTPGACFIPAGLTDSILIVFGQGGPGTGAANPGALPYTAVLGATPLTAIPGSQIPDAPSNMEAFYLLNPPADPGASGAQLAVTDSAANGMYKGYIVLSGVDQADPIGDVVTASGTGTAAASGAIAGGADVQFLNAIFGVGTPAGSSDPTPDAGQTASWIFNAGSGIIPSGHIETGGGYGDSSPSWTLSQSKDWTAIGLAVNGAGSAGDDGPADTVLQGNETHGTSVRATRCDHAHAHGLLSDGGTHYHEADQIDGLANIDHDDLTNVTANQHHAEDHASRHEDGGADELEVEDLATAETDTDLVLRPDGGGGVIWAADSGSGGGGGSGVASPFWWHSDNAPGSPNAADREFTAALGDTRVSHGTPKGTWAVSMDGAEFSQTATGATDLDVWAIARTCSVGDYVTIAAEAPFHGVLLGAFVGFSDGTTFGTSDAVGVSHHFNGLSHQVLLNTWTNFNSRLTDGSVYAAGTVSTVIGLRVKYEASNTWGLYVRHPGGDWKPIQTNYASTLTPTHVLYGVSMTNSPTFTAGNAVRLECFRVND